jgi:hypothetical protein
MTDYRQIDRIVTAKQTVFGAGFKSYDVEQQQLGRNEFFVAIFLSRNDS